MSQTPKRRTSRLTTPVMITFGVVAALLLGLTITSVVKAMTRGDDPVVVNEVLTGQSMEVNRITGLDVIRFQSVRSPLPQDEDVDDTLDTCMAAEARDHLSIRRRKTASTPPSPSTMRTACSPPPSI